MACQTYCSNLFLLNLFFLYLKPEGSLALHLRVLALIDFFSRPTNSHTYATVLRLSVRLSVVCDVMYCG